MSSRFGERLVVTVFGESHGPAVGAVADGFPAGFPVDPESVSGMMARRAPGRNMTSSRRETDEVRFVSGVYNGRTTGTPLCALIQNNDAQSAAYATVRDMPRPSHADYAARLRYGDAADLRGGGHFSGRLTAPICALGAVAADILKEYGVEVFGHLRSVGTERDDPVDLSAPDREALLEARQRAVPAVSSAVAERMAARIAQARDEGDSLGGVMELFITGLPAGLGDPMFGGTENRFAVALFGIPGVRGVSFGEGFDAAEMTGSTHNDPFTAGEDGRAVPLTNHAGGILGGITTGAPLVCRVAVKPTPSISLPQETIDLRTGKTETLIISGRHDPCIALRALPAAEAAAALTALDMMLIEGKIGDKK